MSVSLIALEDHHMIWNHSKRAVFAVPLPNQPCVYMCVTVTPSDDRQAVVMVDAQKFVTLWRRAPKDSIEHRLAWGTPETWRANSKFGWAVQGFARGRINPVPLAQVGYGATPGDAAWVSFANGITRTIWLLTHGCPTFPVQCHIYGAEELWQDAGTEGSTHVTLSDLYHGARP